MNKVILIGRLTKEPEVKQTPSQISVCTFSVAVNRKFKNQDGSYQTDYINCVAWRQLADIMGQYFHKGSRIGIVGNIQTRSYDDQNGQKKYITEVIVDEIEFLENKTEQKTERESIPPVPPVPPKAEPIENEAEVDESQLPFDIF